MLFRSEELFQDDVARRALIAVAEAEGAIEAALELADPETRELLERAAVADVDADPHLEARNLIAAATRRLLQQRVSTTDPDELLRLRDVRLHLEQLDDPATAEVAMDVLLSWLAGADEEHE